MAFGQRWTIVGFQVVMLAPATHTMSQDLLQDARLRYPGCIMAFAAIFQLLADPKCLASKLRGD
jgi:hypothetical protein